MIVQEAFLISSLEKFMSRIWDKKYTYIASLNPFTS